MSEAIWRALAQKALGGQPLETLTGSTAEGLPIEPLYGRSAGDCALALRQTEGPWAIAQRVDHTDLNEANRLALLDLEGGADALTLVFEGHMARGFGLPLQDGALDAALESVELDYITLRLDAGAGAMAAAQALAALTKARRLTSAALAVDLGLDPIGHQARTGATSPSLAQRDLVTFRASCREAGLAGRTFLTDARPYHEAGAGEAQELAAVLATGLAYLRRLEDAGLSLPEAASDLAFLLVADADTFLTIAKFRALRHLWARVEMACGIKPQPIRLHAETAWRMMTRRDPWVNVMRTTAAVFAAGIGGADVITPLPFTLALGLPDDGARRLARNTQLVLLSEAHLARVQDPAAGSGGLEALTDQLCTRAWSLFQQIEREGGIEASLSAGALQARIADTTAHRAKAFATVQQAITGTSAFPSLLEEPYRLAGAKHTPAPAVGALSCVRDAEPFEALRDRAETVAARTGRRPTLFLATLGTPAAYGPHATYAANFFAAAGIETVLGAADNDLAGYDQNFTPIACVCAPDTADPAHVVSAIETLRRAGTKRVLAVGQTRGGDADGDKPGPDDRIYPGCNALGLLTETLDFFGGPIADRPR